MTDKHVKIENLEGCPFLHNIKNVKSEFVKAWENFCPRGGSVQYFVPDIKETK